MAGLEQNTELFHVRRLRYDNPPDAAFLRDLDAFLAQCADMADGDGTQLDLVREALAARVRQTPVTGESDAVEAQLASTFSGRLLDRLADSLPRAARITGVSVLAPFFEQDDLDAADDVDGLSSVLGELLAMRGGTNVTLDIGVPWDDASLAPPASAELSALDAHLGALWARRVRTESAAGTLERIEHMIPDRVTAKRVEGRNAAGEPLRIDRATLETEIAEGRAWPVTRPTVHAPKKILERIAAEHPVRLWLHPAADISPAGRPRRRPLHAKLFLVTVTLRGRESTYVLSGSANASRMALARSVAQGGNVEAGVLCRMDGVVTLRDFLPSLVQYSLDRVTLEERARPPMIVDLSAWIEQAVHDAEPHTLTITWHTSGPAPLARWSLRYVDREIARGDGPPGVPTVIDGFVLSAASAEIIFESGGSRWSIPIRVADLATLPVSPHLEGLGLRELLAMLGRRVGAERIAKLREERGASGATPLLDAVFGEGFGPTDVFKAWWGATEDLSGASSVAAFRHRLLGPVGVQRAWALLREQDRDELGGDEIWIYGCELLRQLERVAIADGPDFPAKRKLLGGVLKELRKDLAALAPEEGERPWLAAVSRFYGLGGRNVST